MSKSKNKIEPLSDSKREQMHSYIELLKNQLHPMGGSSYAISIINKELPESRYYLINNDSYMLRGFTVWMDIDKGIIREYEFSSVQLGEEIIIEKESPCFIVECNKQRYEITAITIPSGDF